VTITDADIQRLVEGTAFTLSDEDKLRLKNKQAFIVKAVVLHNNPDLDGIAAYWLALRHPKVFIGIESAPIKFYSQEAPPDGRTAEEFEKDGWIAFDVWESRFDHHPHDKCPGLCATDLVAEFLGIADDLALIDTLSYIRMHDLEGPIISSLTLRELGTSDDIVEKVKLLENFSFPKLITSLRRRYHRHESKLIKEVCFILEDIYMQQVYFWTVVQEEFKAKAEIRHVYTPQKAVKVAIIESPIREVGSFSRTQQGGFCTVCIHRNTENGHVFVSGNLTSDQRIEIGKIWRVLEMNKRQVAAEYNLADLEKSKMDLCKNIYLPKNPIRGVYICMNGGYKATDIEPTVLTLDELFDALTIALRDDILPEACPKSHCLYNACPVYPFGLTRCRGIRQL